MGRATPRWSKVAVVAVAPAGARAELPDSRAIVWVGPPLLARLPRWSAAVVVDVKPVVGRPVVWVARLLLPVTVLVPLAWLLTKSPSPMLLAKIVLLRIAWAFAVTTRTLFKLIVYRAPAAAEAVVPPAVTVLPARV